MTLRAKFIKLAKGADRALGHAGTKRLINKLMSKYGEIKALEFDAEANNIRAELLLHGEVQAVRVNIIDYELIRHGDSAHLVIHEASVDREWLNTLLQDLVIGRNWGLPAAALPYLDDMIK